MTSNAGIIPPASLCLNSTMSDIVLGGNADRPRDGGARRAGPPDRLSYRCLAGTTPRGMRKEDRKHAPDGAANKNKEVREMKQVTMTEAEYERFCEFRGAEKAVRSMRAQMDMQRAEQEKLSQAVIDAFDMRVDGSEVLVVDLNRAAQALRLAAEMQG